MCSERTGNVHPGKGGPDHPGSEGGSQEEAGGDEAGGADERGEKGAVDGLPPGPRLGQERPMSRPLGCDLKLIRPDLGKEIQVVIVKMPIFLSICNCLVL